MGSTKNCIVCIKKATCYIGHVHKKKEHIIAGFCKEHFKTTSIIEGCNKGCYGKYNYKMGHDKTFGQVYTL
jgi:hypothetical protein